MIARANLVLLVLLGLITLQPVQSLAALSPRKQGKLPPTRSFSRRALLSQLVGATLAFPLVSIAQEDSIRDRGGKPFAPLEALLPATRLKLWIDKAHRLSSSLNKTTTSSDNRNVQYELLRQLNDILSNPPKLFVSSFSLKDKTSAPTAQITTGVSSANKLQFKRNRADLKSLPDRLAAMLNQADVERQWGMLQYQESKLQRENEFRAAFNCYTSQLEFGDVYLLTASKQERSRMIRDETLPTVTKVIASDLDVRELYRNQFLTSMDDVKAEVSYQLKQGVPNEIDTTDVVTLMDQAYTACTEWFNLISVQDVQEAVDVVMSE